MIVVFVLAMIVGFAVGVRVMVSGVLRPNPVLPLRPLPATDRIAIGRPVVAVAATVFGVVGVALTRIPAFGTGLRVSVAGVAAVLAAIVAVAVIRRWARASDAGPLPAEDDPRFRLQGLPARVTRPLGGGTVGEIEYHVNGIRQIISACSIDTALVAAGVEVVIERVDQGVAWVEPWEQVEQRM